jgi:small subunit ribosomal protein S24e
MHMRLKLGEPRLEWVCRDYRCGWIGDREKIRNKESRKVCIESEVKKDKMEIELTEEKENPLLKRKEVTFKLHHEEEGASPSREAARNALIKALKCSSNLLVIDKMATEFGKRETVGYAKVYESEERLKEIERKHIVKRNFEGAEEASRESEGE